MDSHLRELGADAGSARRARRSRLSWGVIDQAASSLTNFGVAVFIGRIASPAEFGRFAGVMLGYQIAVGLLRGAVSEPIVVRCSGMTRAESEPAVRASLGAALCLGAAGSLLVAVVGTVTGDDVRDLVLILAVALPFLQLQDAVRYVALTWGRPRVAAASDGLWLVVLTGGGVILRTADVTGAEPFFTLWCVGGGVSGLVALWLLRVAPWPRATGRHLRDHGRLAATYAYESVAHQGAPRLTSAGVGAFAGVSDFAGLRGALLFSTQLAVLAQAVRLVAIPESVRGADLQAQARVADGAMRSLVSVTVVGSIALLAAPDWVGRQMLGETWDLAAPLLLWVLLRQVFASAAIGPEVLLRALAQARRSFVARTVNAVLLLAFGLGGAALAGATGAVVGMAAAQLGATALWFVQSGRASRELSRRSQP